MPSELDRRDVGQLECLQPASIEPEALWNVCDGCVYVANESDVDRGTDRHALEVDSDVAITNGDVSRGILED